MLFHSTRHDWFGNIRGDLLAGLVVALALIPEAIAFSIIAGVDPKVGLYASFCIAVTTAFLGGRTGMISAATGAMALLMVSLVKEHGLQYLLATTILTGLIQVVMGYLKLGSLMSFVSRSVITGFVNALAILIFLAQLPELIDQSWPVYALTTIGLGIIYLLPYIPIIGKLLPSPLVCILLLTAVSIIFDVHVRTVGDMGELPDTLPIFLWPEIPLTFETIHIIFPYAMALAIVGLLESLMTATIIDDLTDTKSNKNRECKGQGIANMIAGFLGGMAGCAMIGQSVINIKSGGRGRLSTLIAGSVLLFLIVFLNEWVAKIPMAALVAVMIMVSIGTFDWNSLIKIKEHPLSTNIVMISTVVVVVWTHNLAFGVFSGVLLASLFFANKISHFMYAERRIDIKKQTRYYIFHGQIFFNSSERFLKQFDFKEKIAHIVIDLTKAHFWDITAVHSLDLTISRFQREGINVKIVGLNEASETIIDRFGIHDNPEELKKVLGEHSFDQ
jgi:SulP family sulfate permease